MVVGLILYTILQGQLMYVYYPMDTIERCRIVKSLMDQQSNVIESTCVASIMDRKEKQ